MTTDRWIKEELDLPPIPSGIPCVERWNLTKQRMRLQLKVAAHLDGVSWHKAPVPRRWHRCKAQTRGWAGTYAPVFRCACGAISVDERHWDERNSRRRYPPRIRRLFRIVEDLKASREVPRG